MADASDTADRLLEAIDRHLGIIASRGEDKAGGTVLPREILKLAEAWAWIQRPGQSHGGGATEAQ